MELCGKVGDVAGIEIDLRFDELGTVVKFDFGAVDTKQRQWRFQP